MTAAPLRMPTALKQSEVDDSATRLFAALSPMRFPGVAPIDPLQREQDDADRAIAEAWPHARVISFDVFDTLIVRKVAAPRDVFLHLATTAPFSEWSVDAAELAQHRQDAEMDVRRRAARTRGSAEVTLYEIHATLAERLERPVSDVPAMVRAEQLLERALCVAHPYLRTLFDRAVGDGKTVWCVSDTYHDAIFLRELLASCGYDVDNVQVVSSADQRMSKGEGKLLSRLAADASVPPVEVLHIGDHPRADFTLPAQAGFLAVCHPWAASRHDDAPSTAPGDAIALGLAQIGSRTVRPAFPFWWRFGYSVAGPLLCAFASWLHERFAADGVDRAYFLLRDGEIILDVYRALLGERAGPSTTLLESSRRAFVLPAVEAGRGSITSQLLATENPRAAREFLERFGVPTGDFGAAFRAVGLASGDELVAPNDLIALTKVRALLSRHDVGAALLQRSRSERALLWAYLTQEGVTAPGRIALVDIGWAGTIQKAVMAVASLEQRPLDVHGYYLGTVVSIVADLDGSRQQGFLFDAGIPVARASVIMQLRQLVEFICTTTRGSLRTFRQDGPAVVPVHSSVDHPASQHASIAALRDGALAFARGLAMERHVFGEQPISAEAAIRSLGRTIQTPTAEAAVAIGDLHHGDGLGSDRLRRFAAFGDAPHSRDSLLRDYRRAYWPAGLLARREPAALALRALLWMQGE